MPLVMRKAWGRALVLTRAWQQRSGRQRALPLVVNPTPCQRTMPMVLRKMLMVAHLKPLVTPMARPAWHWCPRLMSQMTIRLVMRPRQTRRGKRTVLKALLKTWGGLGPWVGFQKRPCEMLSRRSTTRKMCA